MNKIIVGLVITMMAGMSFASELPLQKLYGSIREPLNMCQTQLKSIGDPIKKEPLILSIDNLCQVVPINLMVGAQSTIEQLKKTRTTKAGEASAVEREKNDLVMQKATIEAEKTQAESELKNVVFAVIGPGMIKICKKIQLSLWRTLSAIPVTPGGMTFTLPDTFTVTRAEGMHFTAAAVRGGTLDAGLFDEGKVRFSEYIGTIIEILTDINEKVSNEHIVTIIGRLRGQQGILVDALNKIKTNQSVTATAIMSVIEEFNKIITEFQRLIPRAPQH